MSAGGTERNRSITTQLINHGQDIALPINPIVMKPLEQLLNVEKGKLLFELFPEDMPAVLQYAKSMSLTIQEEQEKIHLNWQNGLMSFDLWLSLAIQAEQVINKYGRQLEKSSSLFSDQLFDGYLAAYMAHCLIQFTTISKHPNRKFCLAVDLLFNP